MGGMVSMASVVSMVGTVVSMVGAGSISLHVYLLFDKYANGFRQKIHKVFNIQPGPSPMASKLAFKLSWEGD